MNLLSPVAAPAAPVAPAPSILAAAHHLLGHLERGERVDATILRGAMEAAFGACDASGAWDWKAAYDACEAATVLMLRKYGKPLFHGLLAGVDLDANRRIAEVHLMAASVLASNDRVRHSGSPLD